MTQPEGREARRQLKHERRAAEAAEHAAKTEQREIESKARNELKARVRAEAAAESEREEARLEVVKVEARRQTDARDVIVRERREAAIQKGLEKEARRELELRRARGIELDG